MNTTVVSILICLALILGMWGAFIVGDRLAHRRRADDKATEGGVVVSGVFALLGLLIAFTFSAAFARLDARRPLMVDEANAIGTACLRLDLLPGERQAALRENFRRYVASRAHIYEVLGNPEKERAEMAAAATLQKTIWNDAVAASRAATSQSVPMLVLPALNAMIDITTTRSVASQIHSPVIVFATLIGIALVCAALAAYTASVRGRPNRLHMIAFALVTAFSLYVILDVEFPSAGFIRLDRFNRVLYDVAEG